MSTNAAEFLKWLTVFRVVRGGGAATFQASVVSATNLAGYTYYNGTAGVGATLTAGGAGLLTIDGVATSDGMPVLVQGQTAQAQNGLYTVTANGSSGAAVLTRSSTYDEPHEIFAGQTFVIVLGTLYHNTEWVMNTTTTPIVIGTTPLIFIEAVQSNGALLLEGGESTKTSALGAGICQLTDLYSAVDTTDTTLAPTGTNKKYTLEQIKNFNAVHSTAVNYTTQNENIILCTVPGIIITLATADGVAGKVVTIIDESNSASIGLPIIVDVEGGGLINELPELKIQVAGGSVTLAWNVSGWSTVGVQNLNDKTLVLSLASNGAVESHAPLFYCFRSRGTIDTPTAVVNADRLFTNGIYAYDGNNFIECGRLSFSAGNTVSTGEIPTEFAIGIMRDGESTVSDEVKLFSSGTLGVGVETVSAPGSTGKLYTQFGPTQVGAVFENVTSTDPTLRGSAIAFARARGTAALKTDVQSGDIISQLKHYAYNDGGYLEVGEFVFKANGTVIPGKVPTQVQLYIFPEDGSAPVLIHTWDSDLIQYSVGQMFLGVTDGANGNADLGMLYAQYDDTKFGASLEMVSSNDPSVLGSTINLFRARGTPAARLSVENNDIIAEFVATGFNNLDYIQCGKLKFIVDSVTSAGNVPTRAELNVYKSGSGITLTHTWNSDLTQDAVGPIFIGVTHPHSPNNNAMLYAQFDETKLGAAFELASSTNPSTQGSEITLSRARGSAATPLAVEDTDILGQFVVNGRNNGSYLKCGELRFTVDGTPSAGQVPTRADLYVFKDLAGSATLTHQWNSDLTQTLYGALNFDYLTATSSSNSDRAQIIGVVTNAGATTVTLLTADLVSGRTLYIFDRNGLAGTDAITIDTQGSETINGAASITINYDRGAVWVTSDGSNWFATYTLGDENGGGTGVFANPITIGVTTPSAPNDDAMVYAQFDQTKLGSAFELVSSMSPTSIGSAIAFSRARGTPASKTDVQSGDIISQIKQYAYNNGAYLDVAEFAFKTEGTISAGNVPTLAQLYVYPSGSGAKTLTHQWNSNLTQSLSGAINFKYLASGTSNSNQAQTIGVDTSSGATTITLLTADLVAGRSVYIFDRTGNATTNSITITTQGAQLINGSASVSISYNREGLLCVSDGTTWYANYIGNTGGGGSGVFANPITIGVTTASAPNDDAMVYAQFDQTKNGAAFELVSSTLPDLIGSRVIFARARGTPASKADVQSGDIISELNQYAYNSGGYRQVASLSFETEGTVGAFDIPTLARLYVTQQGVGGPQLTHVWNSNITQTLYGALNFSYRNGTTAFSDRNQIFGIDTSGGTTTITLETLDTVEGRTVIVFDRTGHAATNAITIATQGSETINGAASVTVNSNRGGVILISDGFNWFATYTFSSNTPGGSTLPSTLITSTTFTAVANNAYVTDNAAVVTITLPTTAAFGTVIRVTGVGAAGIATGNGWKIAQNASQFIIGLDNSATTTGVTGYIQSTNSFNSVTLECIAADLGWSITSMTGNVTFN